MARDTRRYAEQTNRRLLIGFFVLLFLLGDGLIYLFMGREAAILGLICILGMLVPALLVALVLGLMGWIVKKSQGE
jgi:hypothetical protein